LVPEHSRLQFHAAAAAVSSFQNQCLLPAQPRQFPNCISCEENASYLEQLVDTYLQSELPMDPSLSAPQTSTHYNTDPFQSPPLCFNQNLVPGSPASSDLSGPLDCSYSPPQLPPFAPLNYSPASPLDSTNYGHPLEVCSDRHSHLEYSCSSSACHCSSCAPEHLDTFRVSEYFPYPSADCMDYPGTTAVADDFFRRDRNCDICYS
ncbi:POU class 2 homeobox associating factor 3, partial [Carettochelys insculpta]|uniref:POU class 2 homeobox associating factor 3 n=1 Tax=Carettochelys insculpta TaxID=44489 RepID=UPI003EBB00BF